MLTYTAFRCRTLPQHRQRPLIALAHIVVRFDDRTERERPASGSQTRFESAQLVSVILHREPAGEERDLAAVWQEAREQFAGDGTDRERIRRDRAEARTVGRVGDDTHDRNTAPRRFRQVRCQRVGFPGAMMRPLTSRASASSKSGNVAFAEARVAGEIDVQPRRERRGCFADALAERVPEERDPSREVDGDSQLTLDFRYRAARFGR